MQKFNTLADAIRLAEYGHFSQLDKAGLPYIEHPRRVMQKVQAQGALPFVQIGAILHDLTEDTRFTPQHLLELGFSEAAVNIVQVLDRNLSKDIYYAVGKDQQGARDTWPEYAEFIATHSVDEFYYWNLCRVEGASVVKLADIDDNCEPWRRSYLSQETQDRHVIKYEKARAYIKEYS